MSQTKLYCYVDETGQHTKGSLFIVSVVVLEKEREDLMKYLDQLEMTTGKKSSKWKDTHIRIKGSYIQAIVNNSTFTHKIFYSLSRNTLAYKELTVITVSSAINATKPAPNYKASVYIDGLQKQEVGTIGAKLRKLGVSTEKIRGVRDEDSSIIRLADAVAGFIREYMEGYSYTQDLYKMGVKNNIFIEV